MGLLAGDALLNYAFETAMRAFDAGDGNDAGPTMRIAAAHRIMAEKAGLYGMIGGQTADVEAEGKPADTVTSELVDYIHKNETGAMIASSMMVGAVLAGASEEEVKKAGDIATDIGLAFQIQDDILDVTGSDDVLGKPVGSDSRNEKTTYVTLFGLEKASEDVRMYSERAVENLSLLRGSDSPSGIFLRDLIESRIDRDR